MLRHAIIIGSMKSGTTSLFNYLIQHPDICKSLKKEPQYFSNEKNKSKSLTDYLKLWRTGKEKVLLEASTNYTKYPAISGTPEAIHGYKIDPLFIYIVRNPFNRIISHYNHSILRNRDCDVLDQHLIQTSDYYLQLQQYRYYFPTEQIKVVDFEELISQPQRVVNNIYNWLGLQSLDIDTTEIHNRTRSTFPFHQRILRKTKKNLKSNLTPNEYNQILQSLLPNMIKFSNSYDFDVKKWGFEI